jgi:hypothetical protein
MKLPLPLILALILALIIVGVVLGWKLKPSPPPQIHEAEVGVVVNDSSGAAGNLIDSSAHSKPDSTMAVAPPKTAAYHYQAQTPEWTVQYTVWGPKPDSTRIDRVFYKGQGRLWLDPKGQPQLRSLTPSLTFTTGPATSLVNRPKSFYRLVGIGGRVIGKFSPAVMGAIGYKAIWGGMTLGADENGTLRMDAFVGLKF